MVLFAFPRSPQPDVLSLWIRQQEQLQSSGELFVDFKKFRRKYKHGDIFLKIKTWAFTMG